MELGLGQRGDWSCLFSQPALPVQNKTSAIWSLTVWWSPWFKHHMFPLFLPRFIQFSWIIVSQTVVCWRIIRDFKWLFLKILSSFIQLFGRENLSSSLYSHSESLTSGVLLWCSGLRIQHCHCSGSAAMAWVWFLAQKLPHAAGIAKKQKPKHQKSHFYVVSLWFCLFIPMRLMRQDETWTFLLLETLPVAKRTELLGWIRSSLCIEAISFL